ncbi:DUF6214 family protein [Streptomyces celluloflavus]|uniref:DUF6214 family protein n=1 Tax=Streptomyces celluloflavus TaxID=58344 RepID=A0ABW7RFS1_9ACTN
MSESDFYTVNDRYKAQDVASEWPAWELQACGSAAPAPEPATSDAPAGSDDAGAVPPRLDPLGPWFSARLTFADGARIDVLVAVSGDRITVEDVRADPPLTLEGLAELARWIEGPLDDACRLATGRPRKPRPTPALAKEPGEEEGDGAAPERGAGPTGAGAAGAEAMADVAVSWAGEAAAVESSASVAPIESIESGGSSEPGGIVGSGGIEGSGGLMGVGGPLRPGGTVEFGEHVEPVEPVGLGGSVEPGEALPSIVPAMSTESVEYSEPAESAEPAEPVGSATSAAASAASAMSAASATPARPPDPSECSPPTALTRSRASERHRVVADAYREAQRDGRDPVLAVMAVTGRNRRRSLRLIAGARDEGLLTPRHHKR